MSLTPGEIAGVVGAILVLGSWLEKLQARLTDRKGMLLDMLSETFRKKAERAGIAFNPGFAGAYDMVRGRDFSDAMKAAVQAGTVPESILDDKLVRRFATMIRFGIST